ncbi:protein NEN1-like [Aristolochia californica]|uniref:protein NEN1-like n=1 Tax=Aristolochia californica TaxID=171875 RepID=UPI0035E0E958
MESSGDVSSARQELVFMDVETTVPFRVGQKHLLLEFGAILVCPRTLLELESYSTLIRPSDLSSISPASYRCNGITKDAAANAPYFAQIADKVFDILHGRVWVGHNILKFDCPRIREAFADIGRPAPEPSGTLDSLTLLTQRFGRRAGNMKMATLAKYFGLGEQKHRSLDDVRLNLEVLKHCAAVLFLESCLPNTSTTYNSVSQNVTTGNHINGKASSAETSLHSRFSSHLELENHVRRFHAETVGVVMNLDETVAQLSAADPVDLVPLIDKMKIDPSLHAGVMDEILAPNISGVVSGENTTSDCSNSNPMFLDPDEVSLHSITTSISPVSHGRAPRILLLHDDIPLQICCTKMRIRFGVSSKFLDPAGRPRISIVVDPSPSLCKVLDMCGHLVRSSFMNLGSKSEWRSVVMKNQGYTNMSTIRLHIPIATPPSTMKYCTEICQRETSGNIQRLVFSEVDVAEIEALFNPGSYIDACFSLDVYDYQQYIGIRLVSKKLIIHSA